MSINVVGVDPGPCTGIVVLSWPQPGPPYYPPIIRGYQCNAGAACELLHWLLDSRSKLDRDFAGGSRLGPITAGQIEHFVTRGSNLPPSPVTVQMENELARVAGECGVRLARRPMASVKPWASTKRMEASGLAEAIPAKMLDAYAAGRHALHCAVWLAGMPDPLSSAANQDTPAS